jgi:TonB family protein
MLIAAASLFLSGLAGAAAAQTGAGTIYKPGDGVSLPRVVKDVKPKYSPEALRARIQGTVELDCVVEPDGMPREIRVTRSLDPDLDRRAIDALEQWRFRPGTKDGEPVRVRVVVELTFTLRSPSAAQAAPLPPTPAVDPATSVYKPGSGVSLPAVITEVKPQYTSEARTARIEGVVELECVVLPDGTIGEVRVTRTLDPGLDAEAVKAVKQWRFKPGARDGRPVAVLVPIEMAFSLRR